MDEIMQDASITGSPILVIDDSKIARRKLTSDLREDGFTNIDEAESAEHALQKLAEASYDLLLVDMLMPGMDGSELIALLRGKERFADIPIIVITVSEEADLVRKCFQLGANDFLRKPWDVIDLAARVKSHLERYHAITALSRSERRFQQAMEASRDGLWELNIKTGRGYFSPGFYRMIGYANADFPPAFAEWKRRIHPDDINRFTSLITSIFNSGREYFEIEFRLQHRNKNWNWIRCRANIVTRDDTGYPLRVVGINEDITSHVITQKTLQKYANEMEQLADQRAKALIHNERLATIGTMAAGIAHEINNPLSYISGNSQLIRKIWPELQEFINEKLRGESGRDKLVFICEQLPGIINAICEGVERITRLVRNMKDFSRKEAAHLSSTDVTEPIENALLLCHNSLKKGIEIVKNYTAGQYYAPMRRQQIEQVLINLINNAVQAMNGAGRITISCATIGDYARLSIEDSGPGISPENAKRIFDPFFTTKPEGVGTGLGLSISKGIMQEHGGNIEFTNNPAGGATFTILLPLQGSSVPDNAGAEVQLRLLLLEPQEQVQGMPRLEGCLRITGAHLLIAGNYEEARQHLMFSRPDTVVINLHESCILNLGELLKARQTTHVDLPFFLISRRNRIDLEQECGINTGGIPIYEILSSRVIGEIYDAAVQYRALQARSAAAEGQDTAT